MFKGMRRKSRRRAFLERFCAVAVSDPASAAATARQTTRNRRKWNGDQRDCRSTVSTALSWRHHRRASTGEKTGQRLKPDNGDARGPLASTASSRPGSDSIATPCTNEISLQHRSFGTRNVLNSRFNELRRSEHDCSTA